MIPASESDFILAAIGEEVGLLGLVGILLMYAILVQRGFKTAIMSRDLFGKLMAGGLSFLVAFQLFVVFGGVTGLIPMTGQTTTFLAAGGSSLVGSWLLVGLFIRVSDDARKPWQASFGLLKTEAPPEFLAEQAARRAAEEAAKGELAEVADSGPIPGGDQPTELIIPGQLPGGPGTTAEGGRGTIEEDMVSPPPGPVSGPPGPLRSPRPVSGPPMSPPPGGGPTRPGGQDPRGQQYPPPPPPGSAYGSPPPPMGPHGNTTRPAPQVPPPPPPPPSSAFDPLPPPQPPAPRRRRAVE